jgi:sulfate permease, SulP family
MKKGIFKSKTWVKIGRELHPAHLFRSRHLLPAVISGALVGFMTSLLSISFAVLVFGKALPEALPIGIGMALFSNVIFHLGSALGSSGEGVIYHVQSLPPPIQAVMLTSIMGALPLTLTIENKTVVAVLAIWFSAVFTGIVLFFLGHLKLGRFVRFLPLPVISGFLASVGIALVMGGLKTVVSFDMSWAGFSTLLGTAALVKWLPAFVLAVVIWIVTARWKHQLALPNTLGVAVLLFYTVCFAQGMSVEDITAGNFLLGPFSYGELWQSPETYYSQIHKVDWTVILSQMGTLATIPLVCFIAGLLMLSAIEFSTGSEVEPNFDLETMGISNFMSGIVGGGFVGYPSTTFTVMQHDLGASTRLSGILSAVIPMVILIFGAGFLGFIPRFVVGGLLIYFGYQFIDYWIIRQLKQASWSDICVLVAIIVTSLWWGFVVSVGAGILVAVLFFLFKYSQSPVIRYVSTGALLRSNVTRHTVQEKYLSEHGNSMAVFGLQGYIFFGTAYTLQEEILSRVMDTQQTPLQVIILDFRSVMGMDTSVVQSFNRLHQQLLRKNITFVFTQIPPQYKGLMQKAGFFTTATKGFAEFTTLDEALEEQENYILNTSNLPPTPLRTLRETLTEQFKDADKAAILLPYLKRLEVNTGTKIIEKNTQADDVFFIESGRLSTYSEQEGRVPIRLETMLTESLVGEIGFYLGQLRTATVIADAPSIVYQLSKSALAQLEKEQPTVAMALHKWIVEKTANRLNPVGKSVGGFM